MFDSPLGVGWAGLEPILRPIGRYPHNLFLEVGAEGGVLAALALLALLAAAVSRSFKAARAGDDSVVPVVALLVFWLVNAMVSGDANDNRGVFVFAAAALMVRGARQPEAGAPKRAGRAPSGSSRAR